MMIHIIYTKLMIVFGVCNEDHNGQTLNSNNSNKPLLNGSMTSDNSFAFVEKTLKSKV